MMSPAVSTGYWLRIWSHGVISARLETMKMPTINISRTPEAKFTSLNSAGRINGWLADAAWTRNR